MVRNLLTKAGVSVKDVTTDSFTIKPHTEALYTKSDRHHGYYYKTTVVDGYEYHGLMSMRTGDIANLAAPVWLALTE